MLGSTYRLNALKPAADGVSHLPLDRVVLLQASKVDGASGS